MKKVNKKTDKEKGQVLDDFGKMMEEGKKKTAKLISLIDGIIDENDLTKHLGSRPMMWPQAIAHIINRIDKEKEGSSYDNISCAMMEFEWAVERYLSKRIFESLVPKIEWLLQQSSEDRFEYNDLDNYVYIENNCLVIESQFLKYKYYFQEKEHYSRILHVRYSEWICANSEDYGRYEDVPEVKYGNYSDEGYVMSCEHVYFLNKDDYKYHLSHAMDNWPRIDNAWLNVIFAVQAIKEEQKKKRDED